MQTVTLLGIIVLEKAKKRGSLKLAEGLARDESF